MSVEESDRNTITDTVVSDVVEVSILIWICIKVFALTASFALRVVFHSLIALPAITTYQSLQARLGTSCNEV